MHPPRRNTPPPESSRLRRAFAALAFAFSPLVLALWLAAGPPVPRVAAQGVLVAFDDFSSASSGWLIEDVAQRTFGYGAGGYFGRIKIADYGGYGYWNRNDADFDVRVQVRRIGLNNGKNGAAYLAFRRVASARFYAFLINDEDKWCRFGKFGSGATTYSDFDCKPHVKTMPEWNDLRVVAKGPEMSFYLNDHELGKVSDSAYSKGNFGLGVAALGSAVGYEALFDNFALYQSSGQGIRTPTPSPTSTATPTRTPTPEPAISPTSSATPRIPPRPTRTATPTATDAASATPAVREATPTPLLPSPTPLPGGTPGVGRVFLPVLQNRTSF